MKALTADGRVVLVQPDPVDQAVSVVVRGTKLGPIRFELSLEDIALISKAAATTADPQNRDADPEELVRITQYGLGVISEMMQDQPGGAE